MSKKTIYLETSFISYLTNRHSRDLIVAAHQQVTRTWWEEKRENYNLIVSPIVIDEIKKGDAEASQVRQGIIEGLPVLELKPEVLLLAEIILKRSNLPIKALPDALHMAMGAVHGIDYIITWNFKHMANVDIEYAIINACEEQGYKPSIICTPLEFMGGDTEDE
jgi:predicted nucleic acid-binding protein